MPVPSVSPNAVRRSRVVPGISAPRWIGLSPTLSRADRYRLASLVPIRDQQQTDDCVAFTGAELRQLWDLYLGLPSQVYSAAYIYGKGHIIFNTNEPGMEPVWAWTVLKNWGVPPDQYDPITDPAESLAQQEATITPTLDDLAAPHKISDFAPIPLSGNGTVGANADVLAAAIDHFPISIAVPVCGQLLSPIPDGRGSFVAQWAIGVADNVGHNMWAFDYRSLNGEFQILCRNSWGASYGAGGNVWLGGTYPIWEAWSLTCSAPAPQPQPSPQPPSPQPTPKPSPQPYYAVDIQIPLNTTWYLDHGVKHSTAYDLLPDMSAVSVAKWLAEALGAKADWDGRTLTIRK